MTKHGPDDSCILVRGGYGGLIEATAFADLVHPDAQRIVFVHCRPKHRPTSMHQNRSEGLVAELADLHHEPTLAARVLSGHRSEPGGEMATILELGTVANGRDDRRGCRGSCPFDLRDSLTCG